MQTDNINITLVTSVKSGILSSIVVSAMKLGLKMTKNWSEKIDDDNVRLFITFGGIFNHDESELRETLESNRRVKSIENITFNRSVGVIKEDVNNSNYVTNDENSISTEIAEEISHKENNLFQFHALDPITTESIELAEAKVNDLMGPVASLLIASAMEKASLVGELYLLLSEELEPGEREAFLAVVDGLNPS